MVIARNLTKDRKRFNRALPNCRGAGGESDHVSWLNRANSLERSAALTYLLAGGPPKEPLPLDAPEAARDRGCGVAMPFGWIGRSEQHSPSLPNGRSAASRAHIHLFLY
jgi:hypothetical protein